MTLADLKYYYENYTSYLKRNLDTLGVKYCLGSLYATFRMIQSILLEQDVEELPEVCSITNKDKRLFKEEVDSLVLVKKITVFAETYPIYLDDYGQSMGIIIDDNYISFGTYNTDIQIPAIIEIFENIYKKDFNEFVLKDNTLVTSDDIYSLGLLLAKMFKDDMVYIDPEFRAGEPSGICIDGTCGYDTKEEQDCIVKIYNKYRKGDNTNE